MQVIAKDSQSLRFIAWSVHVDKQYVTNCIIQGVQRA